MADLHSTGQMASAVDHLLQLNQQYPQRDIQVNAFEASGLNLDLRQGKLESRVNEQKFGINIKVYEQGKSGSANVASYHPQSLTEAYQAACAIAKATDTDAAAGIAAPEQLCRQPKALELYHPWPLAETQTIELARRIETALEQYSSQVSSHGVHVSLSEIRTLLANNHGFYQSSEQSLYGMGATALARNEQYNEIDWWHTMSRQPEHFDEVESIGVKAAQRAERYLHQSKLSSGKYPVLFDPMNAMSLISHIVQAISGPALYMNASFLQHKLGQAIMPAHLNLHEDPFVANGLASFAFDGDGIAPSQRALVSEGCLAGFLLSLYAARRLALSATGNGLGAGNLTLSSSQTTANDSFAAMLKKLDTGLLVTGLVGDGINLISGDYSRSARGYWVQHGIIQHAVTGVTLSGNLQQMLSDIQAVGNDLYTQGSFTTGSVLIGEMQVSA